MPRPPFPIQRGKGEPRSTDGETIVTYETPYGSVVFGRDELPNTYRGDHVRWAQKWVDVSNAALGYGITIATRHVACGIQPGALYPLLVRSTYSIGAPFQWIVAAGHHQFRFGLMPHRGGWQDAFAFRAGWSRGASVGATTAHCRSAVSASAPHATLRRSAPSAAQR